MSFIKFNEGKIMPSLIPPEFSWELSRLLTIGAKKYDRNNWLKAETLDVYVDALERHLLLWKSGENTDEETGIHHLVCVACNAMFIFVMQVRGLSKDRRDEGCGSYFESQKKQE